MILRDYQARTISLIREKLKQGFKKILVTLPTGSGKSIIMGHIANRCIEKGNKVLALMHRRGLVNQLSDRFNSCNVGSGVIMSGIDSDLTHNVQIGTIQTYSRRIKFEEYDIANDKNFNPWEHPADVVLLDEAHRSLAKTFQDVLTKYKENVVIGFTATPTLSSGVAMGNFYETLIQPVNVKELIACNALVPAIYYGLPSPDLKGLKIIAGDYEQKGLDERANTPKLIGDIVLNWSKIAQGKKTLVFGVNVKHSIALMNEFNKNGFTAEHLDAKSNDEKRIETLTNFKTGKTTILCNCDLFTEGTDIPELECICLAKPTKSIGKYLQMIGRGARPFENKRNFIVLDHGKNINEHGFYEEEIVWSLEGNKISYRKVKPVEPKEKHKMECRICCAIFTGDTCPLCFTKIENYGKKIEAIEYELKTLKEAEKTKDIKKYPPIVLIAMLRSEADRLGKGDKWMRANYRELTGRWPKSISVNPIPATEELKKYMTYKRIKWAKSQQKIKSYAKI